MSPAAWKSASVIVAEVEPDGRPHEEIERQRGGVFAVGVEVERHLDMRADVRPHIHVAHDVAGGAVALVALLDLQAVLLLPRDHDVGQVGDAFIVHGFVL